MEGGKFQLIDTAVAMMVKKEPHVVRAAELVWQPGSYCGC